MRSWQPAAGSLIMDNIALTVPLMEAMAEISTRSNRPDREALGLFSVSMEPAFGEN